MHSKAPPVPAAYSGRRPAGLSALVLRPILLLHRYLAVAVGLLMSLWCLSGFVMMYQSFPELSQSERLLALEPLDLSACCNDAVAQLADAGNFSIQMRNGEPILRSRTSMSLRTGQSTADLSQAEALVVARDYAVRLGIPGNPQMTGAQMDQWTVALARRHPTLYRFSFDDPASTDLYVSASTGEVILDTNRRERVLSWFGAIPHWLYPMQLRQNAPLWTQIVIWTSAAGTFLAATGLYVGISRMRRRRQRKATADELVNNKQRTTSMWSPYRGWWYWHHMSGLVFGVLVLTWVFSGLLTMGPFDWLSPDADRRDYRARIQGNATANQLVDFLRALSAGTLSNDGEFVELRAAPFAGELYVMAVRPDGSSQRLDARARPAPLQAADVRLAVNALGTWVEHFDLLEQEDSYYYGHKRTVELPVYRATLQGSYGTLLYINSTSGAVQTVDSARRLSRWIRFGLHDMDFALFRSRPVWDMVVLFLLAGVTLVCLTGTWMALRRVQFDLRRLFGKSSPADRANFGTS